MAERWARACGRRVTPRARVTTVDRRSIGALLALAYPERIAKNRGGGTGAFLLANGRGAGVDAGIAARARALSRGRRTDRHGRARPHPARRADQRSPRSRRASPARSQARDDVDFDAASASLRARRLRRLGAIVLSEQPLPVHAERRRQRACSPHGIARLGLDRLPWSKALRQWRDRVLFLRRAEGEEWPDLSDAALAASVDDWLVPALDGKTALAQSRRGRARRRASMALLPWPLRRRLDAEAPTHFDAPSGSRVPIDYDDPKRARSLSIRVQELFGLDRASVDRGRARAAGGRVAVAGAPAGAGDARPARVLARQLCGGAQRDARPLSAPPLAGRSAGRAGDAARQAAQEVTGPRFAGAAVASTLPSGARVDHVRAAKVRAAIGSDEPMAAA